MTSTEVGEEDLHAVGDRIEFLLDDLRASTEGKVWFRVEELVRLVTELYGAGLARTVELADNDPGLLARLGRDPLVGSLLVLHDLHPDSLQGRVAGAVDAVTPAVRQAGARLTVDAVDPEAAVVAVTISGVGSGCGSGGDALRQLVLDALLDAAPDAAVEVHLKAEPPPPTATPVQLSRKPVAAGRAP